MDSRAVVVGILVERWLNHHARHIFSPASTDYLSHCLQNRAYKIVPTKSLHFIDSYIYLPITRKQQCFNITYFTGGVTVGLDHAPFQLRARLMGRNCKEKMHFFLVRYFEERDLSSL